MPAGDKTFFSVGEILKTRLKNLATGGFADTLQLKKEWSNLVGQTIAQNSEVLYIKDHCLFIGARNSTWLSELNLMKEEILKKVSAMKTTEPIQTIRLRLYLDSK